MRLPLVCSDGDHGGAAFCLSLEPTDETRIGRVHDRRNDDVVGAATMTCVERVDGLVQLDLERRMQLDRSGVDRYQMQVDRIGPCQHTVGDEEVGGFGARVQRHDSHDRS